MTEPVSLVGRIERLTDEAHIPDPDHHTYSFATQHSVSYVEEERVLALEQRVKVLEEYINAEILARQRR